MRRAALIVIVSMLSLAGPARAAVGSPAVLAGPANDIVAMNGAALAPDGTGGVAYTKVAGGITHVFVVALKDGRFGTPVQVDTSDPYGASQPAIAAGDGGRLLVVWVQPFAVQPNSVTQYALESASIQPGSGGFTPPIVVDQSVGEPATADINGVDPSLAMAPDGRAYVVYRAVTDQCSGLYDVGNPLNAECPPTGTGEVMDVRVAAFDFGPWSSVGTVNQNPQLADPAPTAANAPQIAVSATGNGGNAVVLWQESDSSGYARIWARRVYGTALGDAVQLSPSTIAGQPANVDADAPTVAYGDTAQAEFRLAGGPGSPLGDPQLFSVTVPPSGPLSPDALRDIAGGAAAAGPRPLTTSDAQGGGITAWQSSDASGLPYVAAREDFPGGGSQTAQLAGGLPGPIGGLSLGSDYAGDALIAWMQGAPGNAELVGALVQVPPRSFAVTTPAGWVQPANAAVSWDPAPDPSAVTYDVYVDGRLRFGGVPGPAATDPAGAAITESLTAPALGTGRHAVEVVAADASGQQVSGSGTLNVDATAPTVSALLIDRRHGVRVTVADPESGVDPAATQIAFGDGSVSRRRVVATHVYGRRAIVARVHRHRAVVARVHRRHAIATHVYRRRGSYTITATVQDMAGNRATVRLRVRVK